MSYAIMCNMDAFGHDGLEQFARHAEAAGLDRIWVPELFGRDPFITSSVLLGATQNIKVGTAIANVYARDARATKAAAYSLADAFSNRFELGLGLSNKVGNAPRGHTWLAPITKMTDFMDRYDAADLMYRQQGEVPVYLAAHGPKLMNFAAQRTDGAYSYLMTTDYTAQAKQILNEKKLHIMQPSVFASDPDRARELARKALAVYMPLGNYHRAWRERGFEDSDFAGAGSDDFVDAIVAWGEVDKLKARYSEQFQKGADQIIIIAVGLKLNTEENWQQISDLVS